MSLARRLSLPEQTAAPVALAVLFYVGHLLCAGWIASSEIFGLASILTVAYSIHRGLLRPSFHILYYPLALLAVVSTLSAATASRSIHSFGENALWLKILLFPAAVILFREIPRSRDVAVRAFLAFGVFSSAFGLVQYFVLGQRDLDHRITGPAAHVMTLSGLLLPVALLALTLWIHDRKNGWLATVTIMSTFALLITFTRSAWLGWLVAVVVLLVSRRPRALAWAAPIALVALSLMPLSLFGRMISSFDTRQSSNLDRIRMFEAGVEIIKDYPLLGVGPANVKEIYPLYRKHDAPRFRIPHLHNNLVQLWAERGVLAPVAYLLLLGLFLRQCLRGWSGAHSRYAEAGMAVAVGLGAAGIFEFNFGDTEVFWALLDIMAIVVTALEAGRPSNEVAARAVGELRS